MERDRSVCVVMHPVSHASEAAINGLLEVIAAVASVSLVTANLPDDSDIWNTYDVIEVSNKGTGQTVPVAAVRFVLNQIRMCLALWRRDEDIVLFFGAMSYVLPIMFAKAIGKQVVLEPRGNVPDSLYRIWADRLPDPVAYLLSRFVRVLEHVGYASADAILTLSPAMSEDLGLRRYDVKLFEHGARPVDIDRFQPTTPYDDREKRIGYLGRLDEEKGVDILTEVVKHLPDDIRFVFIGGGALHDRMADELGEKIQQGTVEITGWVDHDEVPRYLNDLRLLVMTSRTEGVPTTALEAMACGTPVCATPVGGIPDVVKDGATGFLLEENGPESMAARIESIVSEEDLSQVSNSAREFVVENFSFNVVVEEYERVFEAVSY